MERCARRLYVSSSLLSIATTSAIYAAWETSMEMLRPLLARIEATDRLIDHIVYQLHGLTEEEIAIVEG